MPVGVMDPTPPPHRLIAPRSYLARLLETAPVGIATVDRRGRVLECNDQTLRVLGVPPDEVVGGLLSELFDDPARVETFIADSFGGQAPETAVTLTRTDGETVRHLDVRVATLHEEEMEELALVVLLDVTDRVERERSSEHTLQQIGSIARKLQESLLPPSLPEIPGMEVGARYVAAGEGVEVGGDFYDFFRLSGRGWGIVIGDVSGKGPDAAGVTALARYTARAAAMQVRSLRRIFKILNEAILNETGAERFASVAFVRLDASPQPGTKKAVVASAGHPSPLVLRAATGVVEEVGEAGTVLGLLEDINVRDHAIHLHPGDLLVLYTDGLTEARNEQERLLGMFGVKRLVATCAGMSAQEAAERLAEVVLDYQGQKPRDDLAIVTLRVPPEVDPGG